MKPSQTVPDDAFVPEIEQDVLGTLLFGGDFRKVMSFLREEHFVADVHRVLFRAIQAAHEQYGTTTMAVVGRLIPADVALLFNEKTGQPPMAYMASLATAIVSGSAGLERSGKAVIAQWARLKAAEVGKKLQDAASDALADPKALIQGVASDLDGISAELRAGPRKKTLHTLDTATAEAIEDVREAMARGYGLTGHTWGLTDINGATGGIHPGEMVVVGARPSMGKLATCVAAVPAFAAYCKANPDYPPIHACRFISKGRYLSFAEQAATQQPRLVADEDWLKRLNFARNSRQWHVENWGPMPGCDECQAPAHLLQPTDGQNWTVWEA